jgi:copper chaperone CopZ
MKHRIRVEGMTCEHCVASVERALEAVEGVVSASPDLRTGLVEIEGDDPDPEAIREAVEAAGYRVEP